MPEKVYEFQSTPSAWRETIASQDIPKLLKTFQSTPSVWRETDTIIPIYLDGSISIHSLRMEGDRCDRYKQPSEDRFQSTPSVWRETIYIIHHLRTVVFQSTPSVWRETRSRLSAISQPIFQSTPSVWRETVQKCLSCFQ